MKLKTLTSTTLLCLLSFVNCYGATEEDLLFSYGLISKNPETSITKESLEDLYTKYNSYKDLYYSKLTEEKIAPILYSEYKSVEDSIDLNSLEKQKDDLETLLVAAVNADADIEDIFEIEDEYIKLQKEVDTATNTLKEAYDKYMLASIMESNKDVNEDMFYQYKNTYEGSLRIYAQYLNQYDIGEIKDLEYPIQGSTISTPYGSAKRGDSIINHKGIDFKASNSTQVNSVFNGIVCKVGTDKDLGNYVIISHGFNIQTLYGHLANITVKEHESIQKGSKIGNVADNTYCHFALYLQKVNSDPSRLFK